ncbi:MAG TPA: hypothetical protein VFD32_10695 [Dehalococcoidia bacterium]|nr:hypothetical protein [Dehalococcoidia bacterium]
MRQELTAEVAAPRDAVWAALAVDLAQRGAHVRVLLERPDEALQLVVAAGPGERFALEYRLDRLGPEHTAVVAAIAPAGPRYLLKRLLSFGAVDRGYLDALAVGLANLQQHLEGVGTDQDAGGAECDAP